jgi:N-acetylglucosaminyl-diphospho-decaprenol L-rhamnosyltransferase
MDAVVVTHNSADDLRTLFTSDSLSAFERVVVVDNASTDETVEVALSTRAVEVLALHENAGFGAGANAGAKLVNGRAFAILNPDISLETSAVRRAIRHFDDPSVAVVAPFLRLPDGRRQDSAREVPSVPNILARRIIWGQSRRGAIVTDSVADVPWAVAACWFVQRDWFERIGGFDESYFLYFEDVDFCVRLAEQGGVVRFDPDAVVEHRHRAESRKPFLGWAKRQHIRSAVRFFRAHPEFLLTGRSASGR